MEIHPHTFSVHFSRIVSLNNNVFRVRKGYCLAYGKRIKKGTIRAKGHLLAAGPTSAISNYKKTNLGCVL